MEGKVGNKDRFEYSLTSIEKVAARLHDQFANGSGVISIRQLSMLANYLGADVRAVDFTPDEVSARVFENPGDAGAYTIELSKNEPLRRQKFSLAHEIAHIVLHKIDEDPLVEYRRPILEYADPNDLYKETQANAFAAALLIPKSAAERAWRELNDIDDFAEMFQVSRSAAYNRLNNLGLVS